MTGSPFFFTTSRESNLLYIPNIVAHWKFDEGTGTSIGDASGNGRTGTASGSPTWGTGRFGGCLNFDGINDYVSVNDHASLNFGENQNFTVSIWAKTPTTPPSSIWPQMLHKYASSAYAIYQSEGSFDFWSFYIKVSEVVYEAVSSGVPTIRDNEWHHLVGQREGTTIRAFQDAVLAGSTTNAGVSGSLSNDQQLRFGQQNVPGFEFWYTGSIDEVRLYNRALTTTEITALYNGTAA